MRRQAAFTLAELLVVVAIIGLMAALLMPTISGLMDQTKLVHCRNNLRALHQLLVLYAGSNNGRFPEFQPYYGAGIFHPKALGVPYEETMSDVIQLKRMGGRAGIMFCPFDPVYGSGSLRWNSWTDQAYVACLGYASLINRRRTWNRQQTPPERVRLADGSESPVDMTCPENTPLIADLLRIRDDGAAFGWYHGGDDGVLNSSCHTLLMSGAVVYSDWADLDAQGPGLAMGPAVNDLWWCHLEPGSGGTLTASVDRSGSRP